MAISPRTAQYAGTCATCSGRIEQGDQIAWKDGNRRPSHFVCPGLVDHNTVQESVTVERKWSSYQEGLFDWVVNGTGSAVVNAVAGSGKTSSIEEACRRLLKARPTNPPSIKYLVFNAANAKEAKLRMPFGVDTSTFHSAGNKALRNHLSPPPQLEDRKCSKIVRAFADDGEFPLTDGSLEKLYDVEVEAWSQPVLKLVALGKAWGIGTLLASDTDESWNDIVEHFDISFELPEYDAFDRPVTFPDPVLKGVALARAVFQTSAQDHEVIDFADMLYLPVLLGHAFEKFDVVCIDECQDTSPIRREIARRSLAKNGRLIAVGDKFQAIYGFTGASNDSVDVIIRDFNCQSLPLSINYRCSKAVVERAKVICPQIEAHDGAPEGSVDEVDRINIADFRATDAILCRTNAPLITLAYRCLREGKAVKMLGRDIGAGLIALIKKLQGKRKRPLTLDELTDKLESYREREATKWLKADKPGRVQAVNDRVDSILAAIENLTDDEAQAANVVEILIRSLENLFTDNEGTGILTLSTAHRAKGLEWERVFILEPHLLPAPWAKLDWEIFQEQCLAYVAVTRAKVDLRFLPFDSIN